MENYNLEQIKELIHKDFDFELVTFKNSDFRVLSTDILEKPIPIVEIYNSFKEEWDILATLGNISTVKGKAKSRKSTLLSLIVGAAIKGDSIGDKIRCTLPENKQKILYVDTEQQKYHVGFLLRRVQSLSSNNGNIDEELFVYSLRSLSPKERVIKVKEFIE